MLHYRKNIGGAWETCSLSIDEARSIQEKIIKIGISKHQEIKKLAEEKAISLAEESIAVILAKVVPSYESLANDYIEAAIMRKRAESQV